MRARPRSALDVLASTVGAALLVASCGGDSANRAGPTPGASAVPATVAVHSTAFAAGAAIPARYSCRGENVAPPLAWTGVPPGAAELALVVVDPDAAGYIHWVLAGIPPATTGLAEGSLPPGVTVVRKYTGPCPPSGAHHYEFSLYALPRPLALQDADPPDAIRRIQQAAMARGLLVGTFTSGG